MLPFLVCPCLTKKLTVIGTIGQTHGMTSAESPPSAEKRRKGRIPRSAVFAASLTSARAEGASEPSAAVVNFGVSVAAGGGGVRVGGARAGVLTALAAPGSMVSVTSGSVHWPAMLHRTASHTI